MKDQQQRIAVAEACGVQTIYYRFWHLSHGGYKWWDGFETKEEAERLWRNFGSVKKPVEKYVDFRYISDYLVDLDACDKLIDWLNDRGWSCVLVAENNARCCTFIRGKVEHKVIALTFPRAICESFLRAEGKWVD